MKKQIVGLLLSGLMFTGTVLAQVSITHGPFVGAVTEQSARVYVRTQSPGAVTLELATNENFSNPIVINGNTTADLDNTALLDVAGLQPDTKYYYRFAGASGAGVQSFMTFPPNGTASDFTFAFGSCQKFSGLPPNEPIFTKVQEANPRFFLQCGDWGYPDTTDNYPTDSNFFAYSPQRFIDSYHARYSGTQMREVLKTTPMAYVYDDHDYVNNNASATSSSISDEQYFKEVPFPPFVRQNAIDAYQKFFPHYPLVNANLGIQQSIRYGNVEIFFTDNRASRSPNFASLEPEGDFYKFNPPPGHSILGAEQMQWLLNGLKNSTATWKFIVGGVSFNKGYRRVIDEITTNQTLRQLASNPFVANQIPEGGLKGLLGATVDTWAGFPADQDAILNTIAENGIKNVVFLSSDSHTSAIDDGTNAGIPELMAGNLAIDNSRVASLMANLSSLPIIGNVIVNDLNIWNRGGQGFGNQNFSHAYGKIDVFKNDSIRLSVVDKDGAVITSLTLCNQGVPCTPNSRDDKYNFSKAIVLFPNPAHKTVTLQLSRKEYVTAQSVAFVTDVVGRKLKTIPLKPEVLTAGQAIGIEDLPAGMYYVVVHSPVGNLVKSFTKQ